MSIKAYLLQLPAWKLAVAAIVGISITVMLVDLMLIQPFFHIFNGVVTHMNKEFQEDEDDLNDDSFDQGMDFQSQFMAIQSDQNMGISSDDYHEYFCHKVNIVKKLETLLKTPYVQKNPEQQKLVKESIDYNSYEVREGVKNNHWDPKKCPAN